ncbi:MAG TPA: TetR/AcrR family transcriptional regulator [Pyrinomonadaceae bacterium]|nr:TetR/AcrR family transcriptional regulator [Pyrinomonadaceae bacterium]
MSLTFLYPDGNLTLLSMTLSQSKEKNANLALRQQIMDAARELFVSEGYDHVSMRKIAAKIGYSPTTIYLYFNDKADLLGQICARTFAQLANNIAAINSLSADPLEKLRLGMREYIQFGLKHPTHYQLVFASNILDNARPEINDKHGETAFNTLRKAVGDCAAAKLLKINDVELVSQTLWAGLHGVTSLLIAHRNFPWVEREKLIESVLDTLIAGVSV